MEMTTAQIFGFVRGQLADKVQNGTCHRNSWEEHMLIMMVTHGMALLWKVANHANHEFIWFFLKTSCLALGSLQISSAFHLLYISFHLTMKLILIWPYFKWHLGFPVVPISARLQWTGLCCRHKQVNVIETPWNLLCYMTICNTYLFQ